jgi:WD40 repeat protein
MFKKFIYFIIIFGSYQIFAADPGDSKRSSEQSNGSAQQIEVKANLELANSKSLGNSQSQAARLAEEFPVTMNFLNKLLGAPAKPDKSKLQSVFLPERIIAEIATYLHKYKVIDDFIAHRNWCIINSIIELSNKDLATCSADKTVRIWRLNPETNKYECIDILEHTSWVNSVIELSNKDLAICSDKTVRIWRLNTETNKYKCMYTLKGHGDWVSSAIELSNKDLAICSDKTVRIWRLSTETNKYDCIDILKEHTNLINSIIELSNKDLATCSADKTVRIWRLNSETNKYDCIDTLKGHTDYVTSVIELSNKDLATCSHDNTVRIWRLNSKINKHQCIHTFIFYPCIESITELSDKRIVLGSNKGTIRILATVLDIRPKTSVNNNQFKPKESLKDNQSPSKEKQNYLAIKNSVYYKIFWLYKLMKHYPYLWKNFKDKKI